MLLCFGWRAAHPPRCYPPPIEREGKYGISVGSVKSFQVGFGCIDDRANEGAPRFRVVMESAEWAGGVPVFNVCLNSGNRSIDPNRHVVRIDVGMHAVMSPERWK